MLVSETKLVWLALFGLIISTIGHHTDDHEGNTVTMVPTDYDDYSIADFQIRGTLGSMHQRLQYNAPPITTYDFTDYSVTDQLNNGIRAFEFDILRCDGDQSACADYILADINIFDTSSNCLTLTECLNEIGAWSYTNKDYHVPLFIKIEAESIFLDSDFNTLDSWSTLATVIKDAITSQYDSSDSSPIFSYFDFVNKYNDTWESLTLGKSRGKIFFYLTRGNTEYVKDLVDASGDTSNEFNNWFAGVSDVLFGSCNKNTREGAHCEFVQNTNGDTINDLHSDRNYSHIFTSNIDEKFIQLEDYYFDPNGNWVATSTSNMTINQWLIQSWYYNIKLSDNTYSSGCTITSDAVVIEDSGEDGNDNDDGFDICALYDFIAYYLDDSDIADEIISNYTSQGITYINDLDDFENNVYNVYVNEIFFEFNDDNIYDPQNRIDRFTTLINSEANLLKTGYPFGTNIYSKDNSYNVTLEYGCDTIYPTDADTSTYAVLKYNNVCLYLDEVEITDSSEDSGVVRGYGMNNGFVMSIVGMVAMMYFVRG